MNFTIFRFNFLFFLLAGLVQCDVKDPEPSIDRFEVVSRHDIVYTRAEPAAPLTVGNGKFAFSTDPTGMQTFMEVYDQGVPLSTMAEWGWNNRANPHGYVIEDTYREFDSHGRKVMYPYDPIIDPLSRRGPEYRKFGSDAARWLFENPHRIGLGRIGMVLRKRDGTPASIDDLENIRQHLELWTGTLTSSFELEGTPVRVVTVVHPELDLVAFTVQSPLVENRQLGIQIRFPYASGNWTGAPEDWDSPEKHTTVLDYQSAKRVDFSRKIDDATYRCTVSLPEEASFCVRSRHRYEIVGGSADQLEFGVLFSEHKLPPGIPGFTETRDAAVAYWKEYWSNGGMVDLSGSSDPRWKELEKRIVLSQYVTAVNCAGTLPPQESGLVMNTWSVSYTHLTLPTTPYV
jgi:hypothetical protein